MNLGVLNSTGLKKLLQKGEELPALYTDPTFAKSANWVLSTSQLSVRATFNLEFFVVTPPLTLAANPLFSSHLVSRLGDTEPSWMRDTVSLTLSTTDAFVSRSLARTLRPRAFVSPSPHRRWWFVVVVFSDRGFFFPLFLETVEFKAYLEESCTDVRDVMEKGIALQADEQKAKL